MPRIAMICTGGMYHVFVNTMLSIQPNIEISPPLDTWGKVLDWINTNKPDGIVLDEGIAFADRVKTLGWPCAVFSGDMNQFAAQFKVMVEKFSLNIPQNTAPRIQYTVSDEMKQADEEDRSGLSDQDEGSLVEEHPDKDADAVVKEEPDVLSTGQNNDSTRIKIPFEVVSENSNHLDMRSSDDDFKNGEDTEDLLSKKPESVQQKESALERQKPRFESVKAKILTVRKLTEGALNRQKNEDKTAENKRRRFILPKTLLSKEIRSHGPLRIAFYSPKGNAGVTRAILHLSELMNVGVIELAYPYGQMAGMLGINPEMTLDNVPPGMEQEAACFGKYMLSPWVFPVREQWDSEKVREWLNKGYNAFPGRTILVDLHGAAPLPVLREVLTWCDRMLWVLKDHEEDLGMADIQLTNLRKMKEDTSKCYLVIQTVTGSEFPWSDLLELPVLSRLPTMNQEVKWQEAWRNMFQRLIEMEKSSRWQVRKGG